MKLVLKKGLVKKPTEDERREFADGGHPAQTGDILALTRQAEVVGESSTTSTPAPKPPSNIQIQAETSVQQPLFPKRVAPAAKRVAFANTLAETAKAKTLAEPAKATEAVQTTTTTEGKEEETIQTLTRKPKVLNPARYGPTLAPLAKEILDEQAENPYKDQTEDPVYPLASRRGFQKQILKLYSSFIKVPDKSKELDYDVCRKLSSKQSTEVEMYEYQKFVREYMRQASPYRGLLVYHGLGSGKTCSAIAAAEALFSVSNKKIIIMTPFSLRDNFIREITFCGFRHFRFQNHWVKFDVKRPPVYFFAKEVLGMQTDFLKKQTHIYVPDFTKAPNYNELDAADRKKVGEQLMHQITSRIRFINYNGISSEKLKRIACAQPDKNGYRLFDNAVIIIDEVHNMVRLMQGSIDPYLISLPNLRRKVPLEPIAPGSWTPALCSKPFDPKRPLQTNYKRGYLFFRMLASAQNSKIIGLSGTPLINFPEELGILTNLLAGYIQYASLLVTPNTQTNEKAVRDFLTAHQFVDFVEVQPSGVNLEVSFSLLPQGMTKTKGADGQFGVQKLPVTSEEVKFPTLQEVFNELVEILHSHELKVIGEPKFSAEPILPPTGQEFRDIFLEKDGSTLKNTNVMRKRIQGIISYYRGAKKELMPSVTNTVVRVPMSPYSQGEYLRVRAEELEKTMEQKKKTKGTAAVEGIQGRVNNLWASIYEITKQKQINSYRMFSRQACNFTFPEGISRPRPRDKESILQEIGQDKEIIDRVQDARTQEEEEEEELVLPSGLTLLQPRAEGEEGEEGEEQDEEDEEEAERLDNEIDAAAAEEFAGDDAELQNEVAQEGETVLISELEPAPEATVVASTTTTTITTTTEEKKEQDGGALEPQAPPKKKTLTAANIYAQQKAKCRVKGLLPGETYPVALRRARNCLKNFSEGKLRLFKKEPGTDWRQKLIAGAEPDPERLMKYSPKFAEMLKNIIKAPGSSLVYSQFLEMEGIGIFTTVLDINEFEPITIEVGDGGELRFSAKTVESLKKGTKVYRYLTFTGGDVSAAPAAPAKEGERRLAKMIQEKTKIRNMSLRVFNARYRAPDAEKEGDKGSFPELPQTMSDVLVEAGFTGNLHGDLCRVFCITSAGAEGLSLRNVRNVHIMEPYWNHVRTDQVQGRAVRICSHMDLDLEERNVDVFTYCTVFNNDSLLHPDGRGTAYPQIDGTILNQDGLKAEEAVKLGLPVPTGAKEYVMTSDEYLLNISERKRELLTNIQDLMKSSAVDCELNSYENEEEGIGCVTIKGTQDQFAFHPVLATDIALTEAEYGSGAMTTAVVQEQQQEETRAPLELGAAVSTVGLGARTAPSTISTVRQIRAAPRLPTAAAKPKAKVVSEKGVRYIAYPEIDRGQTLPTSYKIYSINDVKLKQQVGTILADTEGNPVGEISFFALGSSI